MKPLYAGLFGWVLVLLSGCIEFEHQEVRWRYLPEEDVLLATLRYEGIYGGKGGKNEEREPPKMLSDQQVAQLATVMQGGRAFFFNNWISEFNRTRFQEALRNLEGGPESVQYKALHQLLKQTKVGNVGFYLDGKGRLCGAQTLRIGNVKRLAGLANDVISETALEAVQKHLDGEAGPGAEGRIRDSGIGKLNPSRLIKRLQKVEYEQMRLAGLVRIQGCYRINLVDNRTEVSFWLEEGSSSRGFTIVEVDVEQGFARIHKNGQTAKVYLRSKKVVAEEEDEELPLEFLQLLVRQVESKTPFLNVQPRDIGFRVPILPEHFEEFVKENAFPKGMSFSYVDNILELRIAQDAKNGGVLRKECFSGYVPNAIEHVSEKYGLRKQSDVDAELEAFMKEKGLRLKEELR